MLALSLHVQAGFMIERLYTPSHNTTYTRHQVGYAIFSWKFILKEGCPNHYTTAIN